ncbi:hypothetical protein Bca52824_022389 [Brassica carinata]|uniref:Ubiquitin carboxyl-terminal hydrolase n=1 Tax=Brassica carinata TaxID=52824 RepID=A0A8X7VGI0_BRACI|nr:hypothetical protein Bca52824_022389 [Brassica carinata]
METLNPSSTAANKRAFSSPSSVKRSDGSSDPLEHGLDRELTFSRTIRKIGAGLENLGNTCFLNSVVQCLTYTEPLAAYLQDVGHEKRCHVAGFCALCAMQKHVRLALQASGRIVAPKYLVSNLRCISRNFRNCRQEDAHEYMINLLECMHKCCLPSGVPSESSDAYRSSLVHKIFGGSLRSQVKCAQCSHCSDKFDPFLDLSLDISKADSLQRAFASPLCKQKVRAVKQLTVSKAPYVLTVHLKRFEAHRSEKINKKVEFASAVDMKPFVSGPYTGNLKYTLYGVLVHYGRSSHSGHYACFVRTSSGMWYSLDDNRVIQVSEKTVFNQKAYMLFYVRDRQNQAPKNTVAVNGLNTKETLQKEVPLPQANGDLSLVKEGSKAACTVLLRKDSPLLDGSINTQIIVNLPPVVKDGNSVDEKNSVNNLNEAANSSKVKNVSTGNSHIEEAVLVNHTLGHQLEGSATSTESVKASSDEGTLTIPRKTRKGNMKTLQVGLKSFKLALGVRKKKKKKKGRSSNSGVKVISDELLSNKRATDQERNTSQITSASGSTCLNGKDNSVNVHNEKIWSRNGNMLLGSPKGELKERTNQNGAVLASGQQKTLKSSDMSEASQKPKERESPQKTRWPFSHVVCQRQWLLNGMRKFQLLRWDRVKAQESDMDEEYDKGKKKKIRIKEEMYAGPNPFQLIASKKQQTDKKKKWTQRMNTAKTGFRI